MTPEEFKAKMQEIYPINGEYSIAMAHGAADALMCEALALMGFEEGVKIFEDAQKWYE
jgi:hypothetical protein